MRIGASVFAVGRRVSVAGAGKRSARVTLTDDGGTRRLASRRDSAEVAIVAWRPGWAGTSRYCLRTTDSGLETWPSVGNLHSTEPAVSSTRATVRPAQAVAK